jgi:probable F420-dependent oxidoreductase
MKMGVLFQPGGPLSPPDLGRYVEERGFDSFWAPEHTHMPVVGHEHYPAGGDVAWIYRSFYDPFTTLGAVAAVTERLLLGTSVILLPQRDAILTAKEVATVDVLSGGRAVVGAGAGWEREEMRNHGTDSRTRFTNFREKIEAMREIWTKELAEYRGRFVDFSPMWCEPKPVQQAPPPLIYLGGTHPKWLDRAIAYGDGWMPIFRLHQGDELFEMIAELKRRGREERGIEDFPVTVIGAPPSRDVFERLAEAGVERVIMTLRALPHDPPVLERVDLYASLAGSVGQPA